MFECCKGESRERRWGEERGAADKCFGRILGALAGLEAVRDYHRSNYAYKSLIPLENNQLEKITTLNGLDSLSKPISRSVIDPNPPARIYISNSNLVLFDS